MADRIRVWVKENLAPYDPMWVNCYRLHTHGQSQRTTSICEALHASIKSGFDKVYSSLSPKNAAIAIMHKSLRKGHVNAKINAKQFLSTPLRTISDTAACHLTGYCEEKVDKQWQLHSRYNVYRYSEDHFYVWSPSLEDKEAYKSVVLSFFRIRKVQISKNGKFVACSCGLPVRNKYPCRHIFAVVKKRHWSMCSIRWMRSYNYFFSINSALTEFFRHREKEEESRDVMAGEQIWVEGMLNIPKSLPLGEDSTDCIPLKVKYWNDNGNPVVRGEEIPDIPEVSNASDVEFPVDIDVDKDGLSMHVTMPEDLQEMRRDDFIFTQESQMEAAKEIEKCPITKDHQLVDILRGILKNVENYDDLFGEFLGDLKGLDDKFRDKVVKRIEASKRKSCEKNIKLEMVPIAKSKKRNEKRKRGSI